MFALPHILAQADAVATDGTLDANVRYALTFVPTYAAVLLRVSGMFIFAPLFGSGRIPKRVKAALAIVMAFSLAGNITPVVFPATIYELTAAAAGELLFGLTMGIIMSMTFVAAQWAGEMIDQQLGFTLGAVFDPMYGGGGSVISDMLFMLTLCIFLTIGGHHAMLQGLKESFTALPLFTAGEGNGAVELVGRLLNACTILAMKLVAPTIAAMLISDVVLGFVAKTMPQLNVMSVGQSVRSLLGLFIIAAGLVFTNDTMKSAVTRSMSEVRFGWTHSWTQSADAVRQDMEKPEEP